jgi:hypothetical protein
MMELASEEEEEEMLGRLGSRRLLLTSQMQRSQRGWGHSSFVYIAKTSFIA